MKRFWTLVLVGTIAAIQCVIGAEPFRTDINPALLYFQGFSLRPELAQSWLHPGVRAGAGLGPPQPASKDPAQIHQEAAAEVWMSREQALEAGRRHLGQHRRGDRPDAHRAGLAVEE